MPQVKKAETWDGVVAPALPSGWAGDPGFQTSNALSLSPPNSLSFLTPGALAYLYWTGTTDQFNGNARVRSAFLFTGLAVQQQGELLLRYNPPLGNLYLVNLEPAGSALDGITLFKSVGYTYTQLGSPVGAGQLALNTWYQVTLQTFQNVVTVHVQRLSDGSWLNGFLGWVPYPAVCVQALDGSITGAGYAGLAAGQAAQENNPLYSDNFLFEDLSPDPGILLKKRRRPAIPVPVKKKRKRGWQWFSPVLTPPPPENYRWYQNNNNSPCGFRNTGCTFMAPDSAGQVCLIRIGVPGGPVVAMRNGLGIYHTSETAAQAPWPAGTWVVRLNVVDAASGDWTWDSVTICRISTACNSQNVIASAGGLGIILNSTGIYSVTLQGIADPNAAATDSFYIAYGFLLGLNTNPGIQVKLDQPIDVPFNYLSGVFQVFPDRTGLVKSGGLRLPHRPSAAARWRKFRIPAKLLTPQPPPTGPFATALFRKRRRAATEAQRRGNNPFPRSGPKIRRIDTVIPTNLSPPPPWPKALFPKPRHRRPPAPAKKYRHPARWQPLAPIFVGPDKAMIANALVEENLPAAARTTERLPGTGRMVETMSGSASLILGDVLRKPPATAR